MKNSLCTWLAIFTIPAFAQYEFDFEPEPEPTPAPAPVVVSPIDSQTKVDSVLPIAPVVAPVESVPVQQAVGSPVQPVVGAPVQSPSVLPAETQHMVLPQSPRGNAWALATFDHPLAQEHLRRISERPDLARSQKWLALQAGQTGMAGGAAMVAAPMLSGTLLLGWESQRGTLGTFDDPVAGPTLTTSWASTKGWAMGLILGWDRGASSFSSSSQVTTPSTDTTWESPLDHWGVLGSYTMDKWALWGGLEWSGADTAWEDGVLQGRTTDERFSVSLAAQYDWDSVTAYVGRATFVSKTNSIDFGAGATTLYDDGWRFKGVLAYGNKLAVADDWTFLTGLQGHAWLETFASGQNAGTVADSGYMQLWLSPHATADLHLTKKMDAFLGASSGMGFAYSPRLLSNSTVKLGTTTETRWYTLFPDLHVGMRYAFKRLQFEAGVDNAQLDDGTAALFNGKDLLFNLSIVANLQ